MDVHSPSRPKSAVIPQSPGDEGVGGARVETGKTAAAAKLRVARGVVVDLQKNVETIALLKITTATAKSRVG